ncbi:hypothetical protein CPB83DRAFT_889072 [Crepidotus variabilis]|uniref:Uncharacterized protein n=1 Tax=Crepidotus variabilis TaxID=179855 RepID=A0A9P6JWI0_9AGAR|nr:hypothetical protein CPB83DRAFT_889072 [Crepidotus variabilis]
MPTSDGYIKTTSSGSRFMAVFTINDTAYTFSGPLGGSSQPWICTNASVTYNDVRKDLTSSRPFEGHVGPKKVKFQLDNEVTITGTLDMPIHPPNSVSGTGSWTSNFQIKNVRDDGVGRV